MKNRHVNPLLLLALSLTLLSCQKRISNDGSSGIPASFSSLSPASSSPKGSTPSNANSSSSQGESSAVPSSSASPASASASPSSSPKESASSYVPVTSEDPVLDRYYAGVKDSLSGQSLLESLENCLKNHQSKLNPVGYSGMKSYLAKTDADPVSKKIIGFYDGTLVGPSWDSGKTWNREHVWPKSRGGDIAEGDPHMVRPAAVNTNEGRGNDFFGVEGEAYDPGQYEVTYRGDASRIILYCAVRFHSKGLSLVSKNDDKAANKTMGNLKKLLEWNREYPVSEREKRRNEVIAEDYDLRNPFIDRPEYADKIWGGIA